MGAQRYEFAIVGAGASGLMAAGETVQAGSTIVLEAKQKPGKKLLATGNGRCNLGNRGVSPTHYHGDVERASALLSKKLAAMSWPMLCPSAPHTDRIK